jgi:hypothetical protein
MQNDIDNDNNSNNELEQFRIKLRLEAVERYNTLLQKIIDTHKDLFNYIKQSIGVECDISNTLEPASIDKTFVLIRLNDVSFNGFNPTCLVTINIIIDSRLSVYMRKKKMTQLREKILDILDNFDIQSGYIYKGYIEIFKYKLVNNNLVLDNGPITI